MSRWCTKHIKERTLAELREFATDARQQMKGLDPRTKAAQAYLRRIQHCNQELRRRGEDEVR